MAYKNDSGNPQFSLQVGSWWKDSFTGFSYSFFETVATAAEKPYHVVLQNWVGPDEQANRVRPFFFFFGCRCDIKVLL